MYTIKITKVINQVSRIGEDEFVIVDCIQPGIKEPTRYCISFPLSAKISKVILPADVNVVLTSDGIKFVDFITFATAE
jgi:hypothetical protein